MQAEQVEAGRSGAGALIVVGRIGREARQRDDPFADAEACHALAHGLHFTGSVIAQDMRPLQLGHDRALADVILQAVQSGGQDLDEHLTGLGLGRWDLLYFKDIEIPEFMNNCCFHFYFLSLWFCPLGDGYCGTTASFGFAGTVYWNCGSISV